jgi:hypothetical protein
MQQHERALLEQIEAELQANGVALDPLLHYHERRLSLFWRGYHLLLHAAQQIYGAIPPFLFSAFAPEDAGAGASLQQLIYHALGGRRLHDELSVLGSLYNSLLGLIDKCTDEFSQLLPALRIALTPQTLLALLQLERPLPLPRPSLDVESNAGDVARLDLLLTGIEAYVARAARLARQSGRQHLWSDFCAIYSELMEHQFASATLAFATCEPSSSALATAIGRTAPTLWSYFINAWLAEDTPEADRRQCYREAVEAWGEAVVLSEDLCDLLVDIKEGRWNSVTLLAVLEYGLPLTAASLREAPQEALEQLLIARIPALVTRRMCLRYRQGFEQLEALAPGQFSALEVFGRDLLCYPLFSQQMDRPSLVTRAERKQPGAAPTAIPGSADQAAVGQEDRRDPGQSMPRLTLTHFPDLGFSLVASPGASQAALFRHEDGQVFSLAGDLASLIRQAAHGAPRSWLEESCRRQGKDPRALETFFRTRVLPSAAAASPTREGMTSIYRLIPVTRPPTLALQLGYLGQHLAERITQLGQRVRQQGSLYGVLLISASEHVPADPEAWCVELQMLRDLVDEIQMETDADLRIVLRAHAALCSEMAAAAPTVDHLSAGLTQHDEYFPLAALGAGWKSVSIRLRDARLDEAPALLRRWRDEGARFFELPLPLATRLYPLLRSELLPTPGRRALLVHHYCLMFARLLRREQMAFPHLPPGSHCAGRPSCWARQLCAAYPQGDPLCRARCQLAALSIYDFEYIVLRLKRFLALLGEGKRLPPLLDFVGGLADAIALGWEGDAGH